MAPGFIRATRILVDAERSMSGSDQWARGVYARVAGQRKDEHEADRQRKAVAAMQTACRDRARRDGLIWC